MELQLMSSYELKEKKPVRAFLAVGTVEAHGPAPLGTDNIIPQAFVRELVKEFDGVVLPPFNYGINKSLQAHYGSFGISQEAFQGVIYDIGRSLRQHGFREFIIVNGHGGNSGALKSVAYRIHSDFDLKVAVLEWWGMVDSDEHFPEGMVGHAGLDEISLVIHEYPELLENLQRTGRVKASSFKPGLVLYPNTISILMYHGEKEIDYSLLSKERADKFFEAVLQSMRDLLGEVLEGWSKMD